jgi:uncharacterized protein YdhG (YjbR/CyaY superfamily)
VPTPIDGYLAKQPPAARRTLRTVRAALKKGLPRAEEVISYGIPALRSEGRVVIFFAGWKDHYAVYPVGELVRRELADAIAPYDHAKGTLRFSYEEPVPVTLLGRVAKLRAREVATLAPPRKRLGEKKPRV